MTDETTAQRIARMYHDQAGQAAQAAVQQVVVMNGDVESNPSDRSPDPMPELAMGHLRVAQQEIDAAIKAGQRTRRSCIGGELELVESWKAEGNDEENALDAADDAGVFTRPG